MSDTKEYEDRIVAFVDILGFKQLVNESIKDSNKISEIFSYLKYLKAWENDGKNDWSIKKELYFNPITESITNDQEAKYDVLETTSCTCFSDSLVVSVPYDNQNINERFSALVANLIYIGGKLIQAGVAWRGGMTVGNLIHEDNIVMGPALIEAYQLEQNKAVYPRIILSEVLREKLELNFSENGTQKYLHDSYVIEYFDREIGFDQLRYFETIYKNALASTKNLCTETYKQEPERAKNFIEKSLQNPSYDVHTLKKYIFLLQRFNLMEISCDVKIDTSLLTYFLLKI